MQTSAAGNKRCTPRGFARGIAHGIARGFTLIELLVVMAIVAIGSGGVMFAVRDPSAAQLEREAQRLASLLEAGRAVARTTGQPVQWRAVGTGFRFEGAAVDSQLPQDWLSDAVQVSGTPVLVLGPEPIIGPQSVELVSVASPFLRLRVGTDGLRPFGVVPAGAAQPGTP